MVRLAKAKRWPRIKACARRKVRSWPKAPLLGFEQAQQRGQKRPECGDRWWGALGAGMLGHESASVGFRFRVLVVP